MRKTAKKLFSIFLAVVLVAGMLPAGSIAFAAGETDTESIQFLGTGSYKNVDEITSYDTAWQNANWKYIDGSGNWTTRQMRQSSGGNANSLRLQAGALPDDASTYESWMAFKVKFANENLTAGKYSLTMDGTAGANAATFWFAKADSAISDENAENYMTDANSLETLSTIAASNTIGEDIAIADLDSEYVLVMKVTGNVRFHISNFTFTRTGDLPTVEPAIESVTFVGGTSNIQVEDVNAYGAKGQDLNWMFLDWSNTWNTKMIRQSGGSDPNVLRLKAASADGAWIAFKIDFQNEALTPGVYSLSTTTTHLTAAANGTAGAKFWFAEATSGNAADYMTDANLIKEANSSDPILTAYGGPYVLSENIIINDPTAEHVLVVEFESDIRLSIADFTFTRTGDLPAGDDSTGGDSTELLSGNVNVFVHSLVDGEAKKDGITADNGIIAGNINSVARGKEITLTATGIEDKEFKYWQSASGIILSEEESYTFNANSNTAILGVYESEGEAEDGTDVTVRFFNGFGSLIQKVVKAKGTLFAEFASAVTDKDYRGYAFASWMNADDSITDETAINKNDVVVAQYTENPAKIYDVTGIVNPGKYAYDEEVTAESEDANFSYWTRNGEIVSYNPTYTFSVWGKTDVAAVCDGTKAAAPAVILDNDGDAYMVEYSLPAGYTFIEAGIVFSNSGTPSINSCTSKASSKKLAGIHGQFTAKPSGTETKARGYVIYRDLEDNLMISYAD